jgi:hypothetical protein
MLRPAGRIMMWWAGSHERAAGCSVTDRRLSGIRRFRRSRCHAGERVMPANRAGERVVPAPSPVSRDGGVERRPGARNPAALAGFVTCRDPVRGRRSAVGSWTGPATGARRRAAVARRACRGTWLGPACRDAGSAGSLLPPPILERPLNGSDVRVAIASTAMRQMDHCWGRTHVEVTLPSAPSTAARSRNTIHVAMRDSSSNRASPPAVWTGAWGPARFRAPGRYCLT